jgi:pimeloyl-ACP methyl ester carboxylesterase
VGVDKVPQGATPDWTFGGSGPHAPRFFGHEGVRLHYVDEGTGEPVVMLHGNPTWGYVYRNFAAPSSANGRCAVPDHVGFGRSDKPLELVVNQWTDVCPRAEARRIEGAGHSCRRTSRIGSWR